MKWVFCFLLLPLTLFAGELQPRTVIGIYSSDPDAMPEETTLHLRYEMPLNYLGYTLEFHDIADPLPELDNRDDVAAVIVAFQTGKLRDPEAFLKWGIHQMQRGIKWIQVGLHAFNQNLDKKETSTTLIENYFNHFGLERTTHWVAYTFDTTLNYIVPKMTRFEREFPTILPGFGQMNIKNNGLKPYLTIQNGEGKMESVLIAAGPKGGYIAPGYAYYFGKLEKFKTDATAWYVNPFLFFETILESSGKPIPDTTTLAGRRMYYSHVDGDGWNNLTDLEEYREPPTLSSTVIMEEAFRRYPRLPVTVGVIGGDVDTDWAGTEKSREIAKKMLALPQVEVASHTYSHPFDWYFFKDGRIEKELPYLPFYPYDTWESSAVSWFRAVTYKRMGKRQKFSTYGIQYLTPRAYAFEPFNINLEIQGSLDFINQLAPKDKKARLMQWSGNCLPWGGAIKKADAANVPNINGGNNIFDARHPSYTYLGPLGRRPDGAIQIYASMNNENEYTDDWTDRFYGFRYVIETFQNSESPRRIKPINVYYHFYSGEKDASTNALLEVLEYAASQEIIPIWTSHFARLARGFYTCKIYEEGPRHWRVENRGELQTIRFDPPFEGSVNLPSSNGVVGYRTINDQLYVYLDESVEVPEIIFSDDPSPLPYLIESRFAVWDVQRTSDKVSFLAKGFGPLEMRWQMGQPGTYVLKGDGQEQTAKAEPNGDVSFQLEAEDDTPISYQITREER